MTQSEHRMELNMGRLLRAGVITCCTIMAAGAILYLLKNGAEQPSYAHFHGEPLALKSAGGVLKLARGGSARGIIQLGALLMIATPVMRVAFAVAGFAGMKDWKFTAISLVVLGLLISGLLSH